MAQSGQFIRSFHRRLYGFGVWYGRAKNSAVNKRSGQKRDQLAPPHLNPSSLRRSRYFDQTATVVAMVVAIF